MKKVALKISIASLAILLTGCASKIPSPSSDDGVWGVASASYEASSQKGYRRGGYSRGGVATTVAIQKSFHSLGVGGEVASRL